MQCNSVVLTLSCAILPNILVEKWKNKGKKNSYKCLNNKIAAAHKKKDDRSNNNEKKTENTNGGKKAQQGGTEIVPTRCKVISRTVLKRKTRIYSNKKNVELNFEIYSFNDF